MCQSSLNTLLHCVAVFLGKKVDVLNFKAESHHPLNVTGFQSERDGSED